MLAKIVNDDAVNQKKPGVLEFFPSKLAPTIERLRLLNHCQAINAEVRCRKPPNVAPYLSQTAAKTRSTLYRSYPQLTENSALSTFWAETCEYRKDSIHRALWGHLHSDSLYCFT
ncbi:hypothetical protein CUU62_09715 [Pseudomonas sp. WP001]|nr:hypothetical protein CUU62_09715 [Pseudomonas sp. WP001]